MKIRVYRDFDVRQIEGNRVIAATIRNAVMAGYAITFVSPNGADAPVKKRRVFRKRLRGPAPKGAKQQRDKEIVQLRQNGWPYSRIGKRYGISAPRCAQIVTRERTAAKKAVKA